MHTYGELDLDDFKSLDNYNEKMAKINAEIAKYQKDWQESYSKHFNNDIFEVHEDREHVHKVGGVSTMEVIIPVVSLIGVVVLLVLLCKCCCQRRNRGHVITPPPPPGTVTAAQQQLYPQQQYATVVAAYPVAAPYPPAMQAVTATYPVAAAPYPVAAVPYPAAGAPYPAAGAPYPTSMPQPAGTAPYPTAYPHPQPANAPSAPDANALPPSYEQATGAEYKHSTPYNPAY